MDLNTLRHLIKVSCGKTVKNSHLESSTAYTDYSTIQNLPYMHAPLVRSYIDLFQTDLSENCPGKKLSKMLN